MSKRIFFAVDAHGSDSIWKKWLKMPEVHKADVLMFCGDLTGKFVVPIIRQSDGTYTTDYFQKNQVLKSEAEVKRMEETLSDIGAYPLRATLEEVNELKESPSKVEKVITESIKDRIKKWMDLLVERIDTKTILTLSMPGNDDIFDIDPIIKSYEDRGVIWALDKVVEIAGYETISFEYVNPTPWNTPREADEKELSKKIDRLVEKLSDPSKSIFNFHCPPYGTKLDMAPELDKKLRMVTRGGAPSFVHVGSVSVRKAEEKHQPILGLHGHIHESFGFDHIGKTLVVNPGSEYGEAILRGYIIVMSEKGVEEYWKVEG